MWWMRIINRIKLIKNRILSVYSKVKLFFRRYFLSINYLLILFLFVSLLILGFCHWKLFKNKELDSVLLNAGINLSLAYISAFIFFFVTSHVPKQKEKIAVYKFFKEKVEMSILDWRVALMPMFFISGIQVSSECFEDEINSYTADSFQLVKMFDNINLSEKPIVPDRFGNQNDNWLDYMHSYVKLTQSRLQYVYTFTQFIDLSVVEAVESYATCEFFESIDLAVEMRDRGALGIETFSDIYYRIQFVEFVKARNKLIEVFEKEINLY